MTNDRVPDQEWDELEDDSVCPECGAELEPDDTVCPLCGAEFAFYCPVCDEEIPADASVCPHCGADLEEDVEEESAPPEELEAAEQPEIERAAFCGACGEPIG